MTDVQVPSPTMEPDTINLQVVSPSVGVAGPLSFPQLSSATTVKELKARIRDAVSTHPSDDHQRLIYQGRLLSRDTETLGEVFGRDPTRSAEVRTLHLVLRPAQAPAPASAHAQAQVQDPAPASPRAPPIPQIPNIQNIHQQLLQAHQQQHQQHLQQHFHFSRPEMNMRELLNAQRLNAQRIHQHMAGMPDLNGLYPPQQRAMPQRGQQFYQDPRTARAPSQVRAHSQPPPLARQNQPRELTEEVNAVLRNGDLTHASTAHPAEPRAPLPLTSPMVYILSSPSGPRALLINDSESYYTPRRNIVQLPVITPTPTVPHTPRNQPVQHAQHAQPVANPQLEIPNPRLGHAGNPAAGVAAAHILPHVWLIIRLMAFVWFFTGGDSSWSRFLMVYGLAIFIFIANTGILNDFVDQFWGPIRRHLENLIPLTGPNPPQAQGRGEPNPEETAARLLAEHRRNNASWLLTNIRRAEHAVVLFLASLVPGVGERHIAAREAEANIAAVAEAEERERREREAAAAQEGAGEAAENHEHQDEPRAPATEENPAPQAPLVDI